MASAEYDYHSIDDPETIPIVQKVKNLAGFGNFGKDSGVNDCEVGISDGKNRLQNGGVRISINNPYGRQNNAMNDEIYNCGHGKQVVDWTHGETGCYQVNEDDEEEDGCHHHHHPDSRDQTHDQIGNHTSVHNTQSSESTPKTYSYFDPASVRRSNRGHSLPTCSYNYQNYSRHIYDNEDPFGADDNDEDENDSVDDDDDDGGIGRSHGIGHTRPSFTGDCLKSHYESEYFHSRRRRASHQKASVILQRKREEHSNCGCQRRTRRQSTGHVPRNLDKLDSNDRHRFSYGSSSIQHDHEFADANGTKVVVVNRRRANLAYVLAMIFFLLFVISFGAFLVVLG